MKRKTMSKKNKLTSKKRQKKTSEEKPKKKLNCFLFSPRH